MEVPKPDEEKVITPLETSAWQMARKRSEEKSSQLVDRKSKKA